MRSSPLRVTQFPRRLPVVCPGRWRAWHPARQLHRHRQCCTKRGKSTVQGRALCKTERGWCWTPREQLAGYTHRNTVGAAAACRGSSRSRRGSWPAQITTLSTCSVCVPAGVVMVKPLSSMPSYETPPNMSTCMMQPTQQRVTGALEREREGLGQPGAVRSAFGNCHPGVRLLTPRCFNSARWIQPVVLPRPAPGLDFFLCNK